MDILGLAAFGYNFEALDNPDNEKVRIYKDIFKGISDPLYFLFPILDKYFLWALTNRRELHRKVDYMNGVFNSVINNKRQTLADVKDSKDEAEKDLLTMMLEANAETSDTGRQLSNSELRDNLALFFIAG